MKVISVFIKKNLLMSVLYDGSFFSVLIYAGLCVSGIFIKSNYKKL